LGNKRLCCSGSDRLCLMLLGQESIRDVILFPQLKPK
jgi:lysyl-tRNA synthetase class II